MRKGIEKLISSMESWADERDQEYVQWLQETELPLRAVKQAHEYYVACARKQSEKAVLREIKKYAPDPSGLCLSAGRRGDLLLGKHQLKRNVVRYNKQHGIYDAEVYRIALSYGLSESETENLMSAYQSYVSSVEELLNDVFQNVTLARDAEEKKEQAFDLYKGWRFQKCLLSFVDTENSLNQFLWDDFKTSGPSSFLYSGWANGHVFNLFPTEKTILGGPPDYTEKEAKQYGNSLLSLFQKTDNWRDVLLDLLDRAYVEEWENIFIIEQHLVDRLLVQTAPAYRTIREMSAEGLFTAFEYENEYLAELYDKGAVERFWAVSEGEEVWFRKPYYSFSLRLSHSALFGTIQKCTMTAVSGRDGHQKLPFDADDLPFGDSEDELPFGSDVSEKKKEKTEVLCVAHGQYVQDKLNFFITPDNRVYTEVYKAGGKGKRAWVPLPMKRLADFSDFPLVFDFFSRLAENSKTYFVKDVLKDVLEYKDRFRVPITYEDACNFHTRQEFFESKYKNAGILRWNYNRHNLGLSYMIVKCLDYVELCDYGILQNTDDGMQAYIPERHYERGSREPYVEFMSGYYIKKGARRYEAEDYIRMCIEERRHVVLHYSPRRLEEEHAHFNDRGDYNYYIRHTKPFSVPKNSKFYPLRDLLPKEFEWIKKRKRLIEESMMMHHCVWSYYSSIKNDDCAIYSYDDVTGEYDVSGNGEPKRYTIEFRCRKGKYFINQIQTKYDRGGGTKLRKMLGELISGHGPDTR